MVRMMWFKNILAEIFLLQYSRLLKYVKDHTVADQKSPFFRRNIGKNHQKFVVIIALTPRGDFFCRTARPQLHA
jgi:hypothetical protein